MLEAIYEGNIVIIDYYCEPILGAISLGSKMRSHTVDLRAGCRDHGGEGQGCGPAAELRRAMVPHSLSRAWLLGREVHRARAAGRCPVQGVVAYAGGRVVFRGKVRPHRCPEGVRRGGYDVNKGEFRCSVVLP
eukprot:1195251-Prorocentrum_minimum.AAC.9